MARTVQDLKGVRAELAARRRNEAVALCDGVSDERLSKLTIVHLAIEALDEVINEARGASPRSSYRACC
jgi:hypothetical protein